MKNEQNLNELNIKPVHNKNNSSNNANNKEAIGNSPGNAVNINSNQNTNSNLSGIIPNNHVNNNNQNNYNSSMSPNKNSLKNPVNFPDKKKLGKKNAEDKFICKKKYFIIKFYLFIFF